MSPTPKTASPEDKEKKCLELARALGSGAGGGAMIGKPPEGCEQILQDLKKKHVPVSTGAWAGASFADRTSGEASKARGEPSYWELQRRFSKSSVQNPWAGHTHPEKK